MFTRATVFASEMQPNANEYDSLTRNELPKMILVVARPMRSGERRVPKYSVSRGGVEAIDRYSGVFHTYAHRRYVEEICRTSRLVGEDAVSKVDLGTMLGRVCQSRSWSKSRRRFCSLRSMAAIGDVTKRIGDSKYVRGLSRRG